MTRMIVNSQIDADGVLRLALPIGAADANHSVRVTVEPMPAPALEVAAHAAFVDRITGKWQGEFERMPQGEFESRDAF